ncbi:DUF6438 domain-containing protein [Mucilaginibacter sp. CAU 1740]
MKTNRAGIPLVIAPPYKNGLAFYKNQSFDDKSGFINYNDHEHTYLGTRSKYRITKDSLMLFDLVRRQWESYPIVKLSADTLQFDTGKGLYTFQRFKPQIFPENKFDKIILSTSGCLGECSVMDMILNADRTLKVNGKMSTGDFTGEFTGVVPEDKYEQVCRNFELIDFDNITPKGALATDAQHVSTTYIKNGKIFKTIENSEDFNYPTLVWASNYLRYLYQGIHLKKIAKTAIRANSSIISAAYFTKGDSLLSLNLSDAVYLSELLNKGARVGPKDFASRFTLHIYSFRASGDSIDTDGRFFKIIKKGKNTTIDLGFNFYDVNAQNWNWKKLQNH